MVQYIIVGIVLALAVAYVVRMLIRTIKVSRNACGGCKGCAIREQMMHKNNIRTQGKVNSYCNS
ncbi:FeoB-associated Cys-rich membrane protein [Prevotella intermedia]|uniref:FeoB-associated Cys-rich membrane protein n=1 Tax=Prevotella intermedia TaxID=28131 RepID=UPI0011855FDB|nr:FeoB-associated Cys-rich membrane protein [Prevotella intermedia]